MVNWKQELDTVRSMCENGATYQQIADKYGVSRERVRQILKSILPKWSNGRAMEYRREQRAKREAEIYYGKWGNKREDVLYKEQRRKFQTKKANAIKDGWPWEITFGDIFFPEVCPILGIKIEYFAEGRQENSPSFDREQNDLGYIKGNVFVISWRANRIKNDGTAEEHHAIAAYLDKRKQDRCCNVN